MNLLGLINVLSFLGITVAILFLIFGWRRAQWRDSCLIMAGLFLLIFIHDFSNALEWTGISKLCDPFEDYIEVLTPLIWGVLFYSFFQYTVGQDLLKGQERLELALRGADLGLWDWEIPSGKIILDQRGREIIGYENGSPESDFDYWIKLWSIEQKKADLKRLQDHLAGRSEYFEAELKINLKSGAARWILIRGKVMERDGQGKPLRMTGTHLDITERKLAVAEVQKLNQKLEERVAVRTAQLEAINHELEAFAYSVSHDLRTPLRSIDGFGQVLLDEYATKLDGTGRDYLQRIRNAAQRMGTLIDDLLKLSRVSRSEMSWQRVDLSRMVREIAAELQKQQPQRRVNLKIAPDLEAQGDSQLLRLAVENLVSNAWKFTSQKEIAEIELGVLAPPRNKSKSAAEVVYFIRDNGAGFNMKQVKRLFGAFQRLHTFEEFPGTGIGLATVQRVINRHAGRIWAEGTVGRGATFYFTLGSKNDLPEERANEPETDKRD